MIEQSNIYSMEKYKCSDCGNVYSSGSFAISSGVCKWCRMKQIKAGAPKKNRGGARVIKKKHEKFSEVEEIVERKCPTCGKMFKTKWYWYCDDCKKNRGSDYLEYEVKI